MAFQPWEYRTETGFTDEDNLDLTGYSVAAVDGDIGHVDEAPMRSGRRIWWWTPGRGSSAARCCCRAGVVERIDTVEEEGTSTDQGPDQGLARVRRTRRRRHVSGPARRLLRRRTTLGPDDLSRAGLECLSGQRPYDERDPRLGLRPLGSRSLSCLTSRCPGVPRSRREAQRHEWPECSSQVPRRPCRRWNRCLRTRRH